MVKIKDLIRITGLPILFASLCCVSPLILLLFGVGTVTFAGSLADTLYGTYKWWFRLAGLVLLGLSLVLYFRNIGICTLSQAKRNRSKIVNTILVSILVAVLGYVIWLYVVVHYWGVWAGAWV
jgi:hypothetical protein